MATKRKHKAKSSTPKKRRRRHASHKRNPSGGVGELATILMANGKRRKKRRRSSAKAAAPVKARRRRARKNPDSGITDLLLMAGATAAGAVSARYVQNFAAMKLAKDASGQKITDPAKAKAQAGKPLYVAIGAAAPVAIGVALKYGAKQHALGNGLIQGGLAHAASQIAGRVAATAEPGSALYPLAGALDGEGEMLGQLRLAAASDGTKWFQHPQKGWCRYFEARELAQLPAHGVSGGDDLGSYADPGRDFAGLDTRDQLGADDDLGSYADPARDFAGLDTRDQLGSYADPGRDFAGLDTRDQLGADEDLGSYADPGRDFAGLDTRDQLGAVGAEDLYGLGADDYMSGPYEDDR